MRFSILTYIFLLGAFFVGLFGILLGNVAILAIAAGLIAVPSIGIFTFFGMIKKDIALLSFKREVNTVHMRQNNEIIVTSTVFPVNDKYQFEDILPAGTRCIRGSPMFCQGIASYVLQVAISGTPSFGGVLLTASTLFGTFTFRILYADAPKLSVYPTGTAALIQKNFDISESTMDSYAIIQSQEVHDFRVYQPGDNLRDIDWKQTLKHDALYVRVKEKTESATPFVIFDLPNISTSSEDVLAFMKTAREIVIYAGKFGEKVTVAFVCGGNILATLSLGETVKIFQHLNRAGTIERTTELYRERSKRELQRMCDMIVSSDTYTKIMRSIFAKTANRADIGFEAHVKQLIAICTHDAEHAIIVSSCRGDTSHLRYLITGAAQYTSMVTVYITSMQKHLVDDFIRIGATSVEVRA